MAIEPGKQWSSFEISRKLGQGGNCEVYEAVDSSGRTVALKLLMDRKDILRFRREFRAMLRLDHDNIARVFEYGEYEERAYFTMELIDGGDLKAHFQGETEGSEATAPEDPEEFQAIAEMFVKICNALSYIHTRKIIHRDLKPGNIMLTGDCTPKLMDFGLLKNLDQMEAGLTKEGSFLGTVAYMSPEQGMMRSLDNRSDLYSLGVVLYEALAGVRPFYGNTIWELFKCHIQDIPVSPRQYNPTIPYQLEAVTLQLLQKDPGRRPATAEQLSDMIRRYLGHETILTDSTVDLNIAEIALDSMESSAEGVPVYTAGLIGRELPWDTLKKTSERVQGGTGAALIISGDMGIGKTRLMNEFGPEARLNGFHYIRSTCFEGELFPYSAFLRPLENIAGKLKKLTDPETLSVLEHVGPVLAQICPRFREIPVVSPMPEPAALEPAQEKLRQFDAVKTVLAHMAGNQPLILTIDDLQWADDLSVELFLYLIRLLSMDPDTSFPLMIIGSYHSDILDTDHVLSTMPWKSGNTSVCEEIRLEPLPEEHVKHLVEAKLGWSDASSVLVHLIFTESGGNPFYVEELLQEMIANGIIFQQDQAWEFQESRTLEPVGSLEQDTMTSSFMIPIPASIHNVISRRMDRWEVDQKKILSQAAVVGVRFEFPVLCELLSEDEDTILDALDLALREDIIDEIPGSGGESFQFHHQMIRHVLYQGMSRLRRRRSHGKVARTILGIYGEKDRAKWEVLAGHFDRADMFGQAVKFYRDAANHAMGAQSLMTASRYSQRIQEILENTNLGSEDHEKYLRQAHRMLGRCAQMSGQQERAVQEFTSMIELGKSSGNPFTEALGHYNLGGVQLDQNKLQTALESYRKSLDLTPEDSTHQQFYNFTVNQIAKVYTKQGNLQDAMDLLQDIRVRHEATDEVLGLANCQLDIGMVYYYKGRYDDAREWIDTAIKLYRKFGNQLGLLKALNNLSGIYFARGDMAAGEALASDALKIAETIGDIQSVAAIQGNLAVSFQERGEFSESGASIRDALARYRECNHQAGVNFSLINLALLLGEQGEFTPAEKIFQDAILRTEKSGEPWLTAYARLYLADVSIAQNNCTEATEQLNRCEETAREIGLKPLEIQALITRNSLVHDQLASADAIDVGRRCLEQALEIQDSDTILRCRLAYAQILNAAGEYQQAAAQAGLGIKIARSRPHFGYHWRLLTSLARALQNQDREKAALSVYRHISALLLSAQTRVEESSQVMYMRQPMILEIFDNIRNLSHKLGETVDDDIDETRTAAMSDPPIN